MGRYSTYAEARIEQEKWLQELQYKPDFIEVQLKRYDELLIGFGPPSEELEKGGTKHDRLYYNAEDDELWAYVNNALTKAEANSRQKHFWKKIVSDCGQGEMAILHFYYDIYHADS